MKIKILGIEKPPFELPEFIRKTGIMEMREALQQKESEQGMKAKMRQRVRPKLGKIDIDYQKLHDAFFRYQTKPKMSRHGDIYYEVSNLRVAEPILSLNLMVKSRAHCFKGPENHNNSLKLWLTDF